MDERLVYSLNSLLQWTNGGNTTQMTRGMKPRVSGNLEQLAAALKDHGDKNDLIESRKAFAEKRTPNFSGWTNP